MTRGPMRLAVQRWGRTAAERRRGLLLAAFVLAFGVVLWEHLYHTLYLGYSDTLAGHATHVLRDTALAMPLVMAALAGGLWLTRGLSRAAQAVGVSLLLGLLLVLATGVHDRIDAALVPAGHHHQGEGTGLLQLSHGVSDALIALPVALPLVLFTLWLLNRDSWWVPRLAIRTRMATTVAAAMLLAVFAIGGASTDHMGGVAAASAPGGALQNRIAFNQQMRKLWEDHITWTRLFIVSAAAGLPDQSPTANRLFQNQVDIGNAFKPFYGDVAGNQLAALLHDHIALAAQIIAAAKAGDSAGVASASAAWYANANQIAEFLSAANPQNWPLDQMKAMFKSHLDLTLQEAVDRLNGNFTADIADYERVHLEILSMADFLSGGIVAQFPAQFAPGQMTNQMGVAAASTPGGALQNRIAFNQQMRKLWEDHITWTRLFIVSAAAGLPDQSPTANRLFQNQVDIGNAFKPFYGDVAGNQLAALLHDHIALAAQIIAAAKAGDSAGVASASAAWYANANQIAEFLSAANPQNWPLDQMKAMFKSHLDLTLQEAVDRLNGNFTADIADYERVHLEILSMADFLSGGIVAQFPAKFAPM